MYCTLRAIRKTSLSKRLQYMKKCIYNSVFDNRSRHSEHRFHIEFNNRSFLDDAMMHCSLRKIETFSIFYRVSGLFFSDVMLVNIQH